MPIRLRPQPSQPVWTVNDDIETLNSAYDNFIGSSVPRKRGSELLDEETKWLAITHKSFDHGRRGFNDRLAFLGKRIVDLQCSLGLLSMPAPEGVGEVDGRDVFKHRALEGVGEYTPIHTIRRGKVKVWNTDPKQKTSHPSQNNKSSTHHV